MLTPILPFHWGRVGFAAPFAGAASYSRSDHEIFQI